MLKDLLLHFFNVYRFSPDIFIFLCYTHITCFNEHQIYYRYDQDPICREVLRYQARIYIISVDHIIRAENLRHGREQQQGQPIAKARDASRHDEGTRREALISGSDQRPRGALPIRRRLHDAARSIAVSALRECPSDIPFWSTCQRKRCLDRNPHRNTGELLPKPSFRMEVKHFEAQDHRAVLRP